MKDCKLLGVEPSTFHSYADMVVEELFSRSSEVICFPPKEQQVCMRCSMMDAPFPGALFAMDGTLCMLTTKGKHNEYVGRKSLPQMNVLVVCDWNMNLMYIDSNFTGRTQDNNMYMSYVLHFAIDGENSLLCPGGFIIADEGFACREHILRPYNNTTDHLENILFNFVFNSTRLLVENAIGAWKQKCPLTFSNIQQHSSTFSNIQQHSATFSNIQQHRDAQDGAARIGEGHPRVRSAVSVVENDQREGQEPQYQGVHGQAEVHPITLPSRFIGNRGVNLPDEVKRFLCHHSQEPLQNLPTYTPPHLTLLHTLHVSYNKAYHITHFPHYR